MNNAGLDMAGALVDAKAEDIRTIHQVNLVTPIELCRQVLPGMLMRGRGHIVNMSSLGGSRWLLRDDELLLDQGQASRTSRACFGSS